MTEDTEEGTVITRDLVTEEFEVRDMEVDRDEEAEVLITAGLDGHEVMIKGEDTAVDLVEGGR